MIAREYLIEELLHQLEMFQAGDITLEECLNNRHKIKLEYRELLRG